MMFSKKKDMNKNLDQNIYDKIIMPNVELSEERIEKT
jgi:hypothetical protein